MSCNHPLNAFWTGSYTETGKRIISSRPLSVTLSPLILSVGLNASICLSLLGSTLMAISILPTLCAFPAVTALAVA